jgi:hypothetical protein
VSDERTFTHSSKLSGNNLKRANLVAVAPRLVLGTGRLLRGTSPRATDWTSTGSTARAVYNAKRLRSSLDYRPPSEFERDIALTAAG